MLKNIACDIQKQETELPAHRTKKQSRKMRRREKKRKINKAKRNQKTRRKK